MKIEGEGASKARAGRRMPRIRLSQKDANSFPSPRLVQLKLEKETGPLNAPPSWFEDFAHSCLAVTPRRSLPGVDSSSKHQREDAALADSHSNKTHSGTHQDV